MRYTPLPTKPPLSTTTGQNLIKTASRAVLDPETLDFLAYNAFNMPSLRKMDINSVMTIRRVPRGKLPVLA